MSRKLFYILDDIFAYIHNPNSLEKTIARLIKHLKSGVNLYRQAKGYKEYRWLDKLVPLERNYIAAPDWYYYGLENELSRFDLIMYCCNTPLITQKLFYLLEREYRDCPTLLYTQHTLPIYYHNQEIPRRHFPKCMEHLYKNDRNQLSIGLTSIIVVDKYNCHRDSSKLIPLAELLSRNEILFNLLSSKVLPYIVKVCPSNVIISMLTNFKD